MLERLPYYGVFDYLVFRVERGTVYPIHSIVKNGRTMLPGAVDSAIDWQVAEVRAREVTGVFGAENGLTIAR